MQFLKKLTQNAKNILTERGNGCNINLRKMRFWPRRLGGFSEIAYARAAFVAVMIALLTIAPALIVLSHDSNGYEPKLTQSQKSTGARCLWIRRYMLEISNVGSGGRDILRNLKTGKCLRGITERQAGVPTATRHAGTTQNW